MKMMRPPLDGRFSMVPPELGLRRRSLLSRLFNGDGVYVGVPPSVAAFPCWLGALRHGDCSGPRNRSTEPQPSLVARWDLGQQIATPLRPSSTRRSHARRIVFCGVAESKMPPRDAE